MTTDVLTLEVEGDGVAVLTLNRPDKRNALNSELRQALIDRLDELSLDDDVKVVVLTGAGKSFCAGFDLDELMAAPDREEIFAHSTAYHHAVHTFSKPLIAAIEGVAAAGGMDLALMCDLRVASTDSRLGQPQVKFGVPVAYDLVRTVLSEPVARELCLTGRLVDSAEALDIGLLHRRVEPGSVLGVAVAWASEITEVAGAGAMKQTFITVQDDLFGVGD
ncbi:MAG: enoyl-CoA hydratase/isomerase family protein [Actinomycetia bacterium]|nr:enoyl-CoA hydratase/isomerase family protein [Actinomycetes bacterium]MCP4959871.1 enoyl-CoA hydratase/isomerase family protein [Actinomycetes bacterium]